MKVTVETSNNQIIYEKALVQGEYPPDYFCRLLQVITKSVEV